MPDFIPLSEKILRRILLLTAAGVINTESDYLFDLICKVILKALSITFFLENYTKDNQALFLLRFPSAFENKSRLLQKYLGWLAKVGFSELIAKAGRGSKSAKILSALFLFKQILTLLRHCKNGGNNARKRKTAHQTEI